MCELLHYQLDLGMYVKIYGCLSQQGVLLVYKLTVLLQASQFLSFFYWTIQQHLF